MARALAHAAVRLSACPEAGEGIGADYHAVLATALQLSSSCPLLREVTLRRIMRRWPSGNADNEVALLEFVAAVLATTTSVGDLTVTGLATLLARVIARCLVSSHVRVARNALALADPARQLVDLLLAASAGPAASAAGAYDSAVVGAAALNAARDAVAAGIDGDAAAGLAVLAAAEEEGGRLLADPLLLLTRALANNVRNHWSSGIRRASAALLPVYAGRLEARREASGMPPLAVILAGATGEA